MKEVHKYITGFVKQVFDENGKFLRQEFIESEDVQFEDEAGDPIDVDESKFYHPCPVIN